MQPMLGDQEVGNFLSLSKKILIRFLIFFI